MYVPISFCRGQLYFSKLMDTVDCIKFKSSDTTEEYYETLYYLQSKILPDINVQCDFVFVRN